MKFPENPPRAAINLVQKGRATIRMREGDVSLGPGERFVGPKGVEHCPIAEEEAHLLLIEPAGTPATRRPPRRGAWSSPTRWTSADQARLLSSSPGLHAFQ